MKALILVMALAAFSVGASEKRAREYNKETIETTKEVAEQVYIVCLDSSLPRESCETLKDNVMQMAESNRLQGKINHMYGIEWE